MSRVRWWIHTHAPELAYLFVLLLVAGLLAIAIVRDGGR